MKLVHESETLLNNEKGPVQAARERRTRCANAFFYDYSDTPQNEHNPLPQSVRSVCPFLRTKHEFVQWNVRTTKCSFFGVSLHCAMQTVIYSANSTSVQSEITRSRYLALHSSEQYSRYLYRITVHLTQTACIFTITVECAFSENAPIVTILSVTVKFSCLLHIKECVICDV